MPPSLFNLKDPEDLQKSMTAMVRDYHSIYRILKGLRLMEYHLKLIYAKAGKVPGLTDYHITQCRNLEKIDMTKMRLAVTQMTIKQINFVEYMKSALTRQEKFMLVQHPNITKWAEKLTMVEIEFLVSAFPMMSTVIPIRKRICARIYPYLVFHERDILVETYDTRKNEFWDEDQPCTIQIVKLPLKKEIRYRILIWVQICDGFKEIVYNHKMSEYNLVVYVDGNRKCLQFNAVDGVNLQRREVTSYTHFATFKTAESCAKFKEIGETIAEELKRQGEKAKRDKEKLLLKRKEKKEQAKKEGEQNNNETATTVAASMKKLESPAMRALLSSIQMIYKIDSPTRKTAPIKVLKEVKD